MTLLAQNQYNIPRQMPPLFKNRNGTKSYMLPAAKDMAHEACFFATIMPATSGLQCVVTSGNSELYEQLFKAKAMVTYRLIAASLDPNASDDVDAISDTIETALDLLNNFGPSFVNFDLFLSLPKSVNGEHLAAILRVTHPWSETIPGWGKMLGVAEEALREVGLDPADALMGLSETQ